MKAMREKNGHGRLKAYRMYLIVEEPDSYPADYQSTTGFPFSLIDRAVRWFLYTALQKVADLVFDTLIAPVLERVRKKITR
jgi:hypothetical protein